MENYNDKLFSEAIKDMGGRNGDRGGTKEQRIKDTVAYWATECSLLLKKQGWVSPIVLDIKVKGKDISTQVYQVSMNRVKDRGDTQGLMEDCVDRGTDAVAIIMDSYANTFPEGVSIPKTIEGSENTYSTVCSFLYTKKSILQKHIIYYKDKKGYSFSYGDWIAPAGNTLGMPENPFK